MGLVLIMMCVCVCLGFSSQQLHCDRVGRVGPLQLHLWAGNEKARAHGEDAASGRIHVQSGGARGGQVHDARLR